MSKASLRSAPFLRPLPRERSPLKPLAAVISDRPHRLSYSRYTPAFLNTSAEDMVRKLFGPPSGHSWGGGRGGRYESYSHALLDHAENLAVLAVPSEPQLDSGRSLLALLIAAAEAVGQPVRRIVFWLDRIDEAETLKEVTDALEFRRVQAGRSLWADFARLPASARQTAAKAALAGLEFIELQLTHPVDAGSLGKDAAASLQIAAFSKKPSFFDRLRALWRSTSPPSPATLCWRQLVADGEGPLEPLNDYRLLVAEKHATGGTLVFGVACYTWHYRSGWKRIRGIYLPGVSDRLQSIWPAATEIDKLSSVWADWTHAVSVANQTTFQSYQQGVEALKLARSNALELEHARQAELAATNQIAGILPGTTLAPKRS